jgi:hypothetical protein
MKIDDNEEMLISGSWFYDGTVRLRIIIARRQIWYGTGDHEDPPEYEDDRHIETYVLKYEIAGTSESYAGGGQYLSLSEAQQAAEKLCGGTIEWE